MNRSDFKEYFRTLAESTTKEQSKRLMLNESKDLPEDPAYASQFGSHLDPQDPEDVEELARYHVSQNDVDATLYRDNPDYRDAFKAALLPGNDKADMSDEYRRMTLSPYRAYDK